jgi:hypothetical protein
MALQSVAAKMLAPGGLSAPAPCRVVAPASVLRYGCPAGCRLVALVLSGRYWVWAVPGDWALGASRPHMFVFAPPALGDRVSSFVCSVLL